jgi:hypothetical protein
MFIENKLNAEAIIANKDKNKSARETKLILKISNQNIGQVNFT